MRPSRIKAATAIGAIIMVLAGCGSHKSSIDKTLAIEDCLANAQHARMEAVLNGLLADGTFGRADVIRHVPGNVPRSRYLNERGLLRPFGTLPEGAQIGIVKWMRAIEDTNKPYAATLYHADVHVPDATRRACGDSAS